MGSVAKGLKLDWPMLRAVIVVLVLASLLRFAHIGWSYSNNGIDEGIMIERSLLMSRGYALYTDIPCDQAPLAFIIGSFFDGDVVVLRALVASLSIATIAACMWASRKARGDTSMLVTGLLLAADFTFLRESRLFSLDALSGIFLAFSAVAFMVYLRGGGKGSIATAGLLAGISASTKLFGAVGVLALLVYMAYDILRKRQAQSTVRLDFVILLVTSILPMILLMAYLGPSDMLDGMLFDQGHREFDPFLKLSVLAYFALSLGYVLPLAYARTMWTLSPEARFLLLTAAMVLGFIVLQPLTFLHHMAMVSPLFAMLTGILVGEWVQHKKGDAELDLPVHGSKKEPPSMSIYTAVLVIGLVVSAGLGSYGIAMQDEPVQLVYSERLGELTLADEWIVSGDPLIPAYAGRMVPPEVVNVAYRVHPDLTLQGLEQTILDYNVSVVIVCYRLNELTGLEGFLQSAGYTNVTGQFGGGHEAVLDTFQEGLGNISVWASDEVVARLATVTSSTS